MYYPLFQVLILRIADKTNFIYKEVAEYAAQHRSERGMRFALDPAGTGIDHAGGFSAQADGYDQAARYDVREYEKPAPGEAAGQTDAQCAPLRRLGYP